MSLSRPCRICHSETVELLLGLGDQPVSSRFARTASAATPLHDLSLGACGSCGVIQLVKPFPYRDLVPQFEWITYREPEGHLDDVADKIRALPGLDEAATVLGLSYKDRTTLDRLEARGLPKTRVIDARRDLGARDPLANIESVQGLMTPAGAERLAAQSGPADLLVVRHILEHAEDTRGFMAALDHLLAPGGYAVIEVPDCTGNLQRRDYTMIWEEHASYFTAETLPQAFAPVGLECLGIDIYPYPFEDVLVAYVRKPASGLADGQARRRTPAAESLALARGYAEAFPVWTARYRALFDALTGDGRRLAAYGAGHLTCAFLNFHGLADYFAFVVDDTSAKQGLFLPSSGLPIVPREQLASEQIALCLFGFAPEIEDKVIANNQAYVEAGGRFASMFADSARSLRGLLPAERADGGEVR